MVRVCITTNASSNNVKSYRVMFEHVYPEDDGIHQYPTPTLVNSFIHAYTWKQTNIYISFSIHHASYNSED